MSCTRYTPSPVAKCATCKEGICECGGCRCMATGYRCEAITPEDADAHARTALSGVLGIDCGVYFCGGPKRDLRGMVEATAHLRDVGGLPGPASLVLSQLLLNLGGHAGRDRALQLVKLLLDAADAPRGFRH